MFLEWFQFFIDMITSDRPIILLMDFHASHISPSVISLAKENQIFLFTFPIHTSHLLQPLDVGVYKSLKTNSTSSLNEYMKEKPGDKLNRTNLHNLLNPAFIKSFSAQYIINLFLKKWNLLFKLQC